MYFLVTGVLRGRPGKHHFAIYADDREQAATMLRRTRPSLCDVRFEAWKMFAGESWFSYELDEDTKQCLVKLQN